MTKTFIQQELLKSGILWSGYHCITYTFNKKDIKVANEAFITSATQFVMPVVKVDNILIGNGKVGKYAHIFREAYMEAIQLI